MALRLPAASFKSGAVESWHPPHPCLANNACPLAPDAIEEIERIKRNMKKQAYIHGDLVAELSFSFWVGLLGPRYDGTLWRKALYKAFLVRSGKKRTVVHGRFNALRRFRNRIAHHEPIFHRPLEILHNEIIEAIGWMCANTASWAAHNSRLSDVFNGRVV